MNHEDKAVREHVSQMSRGENLPGPVLRSAGPRTGAAVLGWLAIGAESTNARAEHPESRTRLPQALQYSKLLCCPGCPCAPSAWLTAWPTIGTARKHPA